MYIYIYTYMLYIYTHIYMTFKYILYIIYLNTMYVYIACKTISCDILYYYLLWHKNFIKMLE